MNREELIEAARLAYVSQWEAENIRVGNTGNHNRSRAGIVAALAVFEQARTPTEECNCAPGPDGVVIHNSWAHEQAHTPTGLKPHTDYTVRVNGGESVTLTTLGEPTDDEREALADLRYTVHGGTTAPDGVHRVGRVAADAVLAAGFRRTVQGEPTDAQVQAAARELFNRARPGNEYADLTYAEVRAEYEADARAVLRAAAATQTGEQA